MSTLTKIQNDLKVPKNLFNKFGGYNYRSAESILENIKPLLFKYNATLYLNDEPILLGNRVYIKATATIVFDDKEISVTAYARESETKKGMDEAQVTGSASSYARKYALSGLFLLDDNKDIDSIEKTPEHAKQQVNNKKNSPAFLLMNAFKSAGFSVEVIASFMRSKNLSSQNNEAMLKMLNNKEQSIQELQEFINRSAEHEAI